MSKSYLTPLNIPEGRCGSTYVEHFTHPADYGFPTAPLRAQIFGGQRSKRLAWPHETTWHRLGDEDGTWMTDLPCEHRQMADGVRGMRGHVLVGGLGLGLAVTLLARKPQVKTITVVERSPDVVELVWPHLRGRGFQSKDLRVAYADIFAYLEMAAALGHDHTCAFLDTWRGDSETTFHETVVPLRKLCRDAGIATVRCWNEDVMRGQMVCSMRNLLVLAHSPDPASREQARSFIERRGPDEDFNGWSAPYWEWYRAECRPIDEAMRRAAAYCRQYGIPDNEDTWRK